MLTASMRLYTHLEQPTCSHIHIDNLTQYLNHIYSSQLELSTLIFRAVTVGNAAQLSHMEAVYNAQVKIQIERKTGMLL